jgi:hypothetical protein
MTRDQREHSTLPVYAEAPNSSTVRKPRQIHKRPAENVVAFYNQRGTAEQWIKEGKGAMKARARSSGRGCRAGRSQPTRSGFSFMRSAAAIFSANTKVAMAAIRCGKRGYA